MFWKVIDKINEYEENLMYNTECNSYYYLIDYKNKTLIINEVDEYEFDGDEWGEIETKINIIKIKEIECNEIEFINFLIRFYNTRETYIKFEYPENMNVITKIMINRWIK